ncbi:DUF6221 family protein [Kitasatospora griseola]|uniref:DUF6221 family protein n=1 Tax=Kitasatospora griseola TaxID=2064 RepID=UPI000696DD1F|nr:DUF6221 family protein [Kitasatospora griseola]
MIADLVAFLRERLDEDYKLAFEAGDGGPDHWTFNPELPWNGDNGPREAVVRFNGSALSYVAAVDPVHGRYGTWNARHIARHDPARVLAEVAAKRRILARYTSAVEDSAEGADGYYDENRFEDARQLVPVLRLLTLPYADHPDYREEWRPLP